MSLEKNTWLYAGQFKMEVYYIEDENWVEGKKGDKIGIFPLSFVEVKLTLLLSTFMVLNR